MAKGYPNDSVVRDIVLELQRRGVGTGKGFTKAFGESKGRGQLTPGEYRPVRSRVLKILKGEQEMPSNRTPKKVLPQQTLQFS